MAQAWQAPFTQTSPIKQGWLASHTGQPFMPHDTHWPFAAQVWPWGHSTFGPHWLMLVVHCPLRHTEPAGHEAAMPQLFETDTHTPFAPHIWPCGHGAFGPHEGAAHTPLRQTWPFGHDVGELPEQLELQLIEVHTEHWPLRQVWPIGH